MVRISQVYPSPHIKFADLDNKPVVKTIDRVEQREVGRTKEMLPVVLFKGDKQGWVVNRHNGRYLATHLGDDSDRWSGKQIELYPTQVLVGNEMVNTIRVRMPAKGGVS